MNIGQKIRAARQEKKITQAELSRGIITRNMLCAIEGGNANPSLDTLIKLAERLNLPPAYLLSDEDDIFFYKKASEIEKITAAIKTKNFKAALERALSLGGIDDEIAYIIAYSHFKLAESSVRLGSLDSAKRHIKEFLSYREKTVYDTRI